MARLLPLLFVLASTLGCGTCVCGGPDEESLLEPAPAPRAKAGRAKRPPRRLSPADLHIPKRRVTFETSDGTEIVSWLFRPRDPSAPAVVLVHQLGSNRDEWFPFVAELRGHGDAAILAMDVRGHGQSGPKAAKAPAWRSFGHAEWSAAVQDVRDALAFVQERANLRPSKVGVVGSGIGASLALVASSEDATVDALVMLSPAIGAGGIDLLDPARRYSPRPLLLAATEGDTESREAVDAIAEAAGRADYYVYRDGTGRGVEIAEEQPDLFRRMGGWLAAKLGIRTPEK